MKNINTKYLNNSFVICLILLVIPVLCSFDSWLNIFGGILFTLLLLYLAIVDYHEGMLYDYITYPLMLIGSVYIAIGNFMGEDYIPTYTEAVLGLTICGILFYLIRVTTRGMGGGDVKLAMALGAWLGLYKAMLAIMIAFFSGGSVAAFLLIMARCKGRDSLPFGPFLAISGYLAFIWGDMIISWYGSFF